MKELRDILAAVQRDWHGKPLALATVVCVEGSAYRRPGARMLVLPDGGRIGCISGGCLESDVCSQAQKVALSGEPRLLTYDSRSNFDVSLELGCGGSISILIERVESEMLPAYFGFLSVCQQKRRRGVLGTVFAAEGECRDLLGQRVAVDESGIVLASANERANAVILNGADCCQNFLS